MKFAILFGLVLLAYTAFNLSYCGSAMDKLDSDLNQILSLNP